MARASVSGELATSVDAAWALLSDLDRFGEWLTIHDAWEGGIPRLAEGATLIELVTVMGISSRVEWTIVAFDPPSSFAISGIGMAGARIELTIGLADTGGSTTVTLEAEFTGQLMVGAIGEAVEKNSTAELHTSLGRLQDLVRVMQDAG